ncbi:CD48 antigen-like [Onychostoma macrolepis]|uniref:CD48 antigen-like n=1 Tax=Onychostoma macrolepis TaxID=369639 RepID=UPI0027295A77|nr:CD48 antigen-like [Onychostoma macrolepis]
MILVLVLLRLWLWHFNGVFGVDGEMKSLSVMEGDSVTLHTDTDTQGNHAVIQWMFGAEDPDTVIAEINRAANISDVIDERFRDRVKMDNQTGSLTITNIRTTDSGLYKVEINTNKEAEKTFNVTVYALLPVPVIIRDASQCSSSSESSSVSKCSLLCSVLNVSHVTLSWFKGNSLISSISASDLSISFSLSLEVKHQDKNTYSCVLNNTISNLTTHLDISRLCQPCAGVTKHIVLISVAAGTLLIVAVVGMFCVCRKCRKTDQEVQAREEEITYADPTFCKRNAQKTRVKQEDEVVYAGIRR